MTKNGACRSMMITFISNFSSSKGLRRGLSWSTILKKRDGYRKAFAGFDPKKVARFTDSKMEKLLENPGIVRNRLKVKAAVNNAKRFLEVQKEFGSFDKYIWSFVNGNPIVNKRKSLQQIPPTTKESDALSRDLIKRGFKFVGKYRYLCPHASLRARQRPPVILPPVQ